MRFKIDENLHDDLAELLVAAGHDAETVYDEGLRGTPDSNLIACCCSENRCLITLDLDFADIRTYPPASSPGIVVLRVGNQSRSHLLQVMSRVLALLDSEPLEHCLWIVTEGGVRIRRQNV